MAVFSPSWTWTNGLMVNSHLLYRWAIKDTEKFHLNFLLALNVFFSWKRKKGFEPSTSALARQRSTTELLPQMRTCKGVLLNRKKDAFFSNQSNEELHGILFNLMRILSTLDLILEFSEYGCCILAVPRGESIVASLRGLGDSLQWEWGGLLMKCI